jgi:hypothetical protein
MATTTFGDAEALAGMIAEIDLGVSAEDSRYAGRSPDHRAAFLRLQKEITEIKAKGGEVEIPSDSHF